MHVTKKFNKVSISSSGSGSSSLFSFVMALPFYSYPPKRMG